MYVCVSRDKNVSFSENFAYLLNDPYAVLPDKM